MRSGTGAIMKTLPKSTFASLVGYAALTLLLTAGAAQSLSGTNTVDSGDIIDGQVATPDLKTGSVSGSKILDNSVTGTDVNEATLKPRILTTAVSSTGVKILGSGVATRHFAGSYQVDYGFAVTGCTAQATVGATAGTQFGSVFQAGYATTFPGELSGTTVRIYTSESNDTFADSAFFLTLICP